MKAHPERLQSDLFSRVVLVSDASGMDIEGPLAHFTEHGWARLGRVASEETLAALRERADAIMLGRVGHDGLFFQLDTESGRYDELTFGRGWEGPSRNYRKVEKLEKDPLFRAWIENALFERIARTRIDGPIAVYRVLLMTKSAQGGTHLPWHQDAGVFWGLDRNPELQIWTALDDAPVEAGCVEVLDGSHARGLATPLGGVVPDDVVRARGADGLALPLPAKAGEALLLHNLTWHRSGINTTGRPRRALTVCYMSAATRCMRKRKAPRSFVRVFQGP